MNRPLALLWVRSESRFPSTTKRQLAQSREKICQANESRFKIASVGWDNGLNFYKDKCHMVFKNK